VTKNGGRVFATTEDGPLRVWLPNNDKPGLAMTRSLGDRGARSIGVIPTPEIHHIQLTSYDKFGILGSDGLFDYFPPEEIAEFLSKRSGKESGGKLAEAVVAESRRR
jgi:serine/threonine protein phosphatase PrpC